MMSEENQQNSGRFIAPWASGEHLRQIEKEVLIPNMVKKRAKVLCADYMETFGKCVNGRMLSLAWACRPEKEAMRNCLQAQLDKESLYEECKQEYIKERDEFQHSYVETGKKKRITKKAPAF